MKNTRQSYILGAIIISAGGFISKILGAIYRIPLTNVLGGEGMGIYQMVYPLYCILLTVSASGIPTGIARLISSGSGRGAEKVAFRIYGAVGVIGTLLMFMLAGPLAALQGEPAVALCCKMLSPAVFFVSILSVVRGYFQGKGNMYPTAITEVAEQIIKVAFGVSFSYLFRENLALAVASTLAAVTLSEIISTLGAYLYYAKNRPHSPLFKEKIVPVSAILKYTVPLTLTAIAMPLSQLAESVVAVRLLRGITPGATALYGIYSGCAVTIINLPVSVTYGLAASSVPQISPLAESGNMPAAKKKAYKALLITLLVSAPAAVGLYIFAPLAAKIIFGSLSQAERDTLVTLVRIMSVCSVTQSLVQTSSACLTSLGRPILSTATQWVTSAFRVGLLAILIIYTPLGIKGAAWAANGAYFVASLLNIWYIIKVKRGIHNDENNADRFRERLRRLNASGKSGA